MTKIDINAIKPGAWPEGVNYIQTDSERWSKPHGDKFPWHLLDKPVAAPEPVAEWVDMDTDLAVKEDCSYTYTGHALHHHVNAVLTAKYGPPPVVKTATERPDRIISSRQVLNWNPYINKWVTCRRCDLDPGDRYVELPKCCWEGEA